MKKNSTSDAVRRASLFGPPMLLEGEDSAAYDELVGRLYAAVKPVDVVDEMLIADVAYLEWELLRGRRLKFNLIRSQTLKAITQFLSKHLDYQQYREEFSEDLTAILENAALTDKAINAPRKLAHECARDEADAVNEVASILARSGMTMDFVENKARKRMAEQLSHEFARGERRAIALIQRQLADAGLSIDALAVAGMQGPSLEFVERIDRMITIAESRRNSSLHEIERRRATLAQTLRRSVQEIEESKLRVIEPTPLKGKSAA